jgi:PKD repeat protein
MKIIKNIARWVFTQFRTQPVLSLVITLSGLAVIITGILWASGGFTREAFSYLPDRSYILAETESEPQTLEALIHSDSPSVDVLLKNSEISKELINTKKLTDIVDSRLALNSLRSLDRQLTVLLDQEQEYIKDSADKEASQVPDNQEEKTGSSGVSSDTLDVSNTEDTADTDDVSNTGVVSDTEGVSEDEVVKKPPKSVAVQVTGEHAVPQILLEEQKATISELKNATSRLLAPKEYGYDRLVSFPASINMKGVWQSPDETFVHMVPSGDWLPENGYKLYRVINGARELISQEQASPMQALAGKLSLSDADLIQALYKQAELTPEKLAVLEMTAEEFKNTAYRSDALTQKPRISGEMDYIEMKNALITIPASMEQKIPYVDLMLSQPIYVTGGQNGTGLSSGISMSVLERFSVRQARPITGISQIGIQPGGAEKFELANSILVARQQLATLSFVDDEFAKEAGFLLRDDLSSLNLPNGTEIKYEVLTPEGGRSSLSITKGIENKLTKPEGLMGYGLDGKVPLRWTQAQTPEEKSILSGYLIERKLDGENEFRQINDEPVAVSYILDETDIFFESPVFFEDTVDNGRTATYRIRSLDVFGRMSEYSDPITFKVEKVTPPNSPSIDTPIRSDNAVDPSPAVQQVISANSGKRGIVLPIYTDSPDTVRFTIYRAVAVGAKPFGKPEVLADLTYSNPEPPQEEQAENIGGTGMVIEQAPEISYATEEPVYKKIKRKKSNHLLLSEFSLAHPDLAYFDIDVEEGCTYKYWVSAWDSWNNESVWSQSATMAVPTTVEPGIPDELSISMHPNTLPDYSGTHPGIIQPDIITYADLDASATANIPTRPCPAGAYPDTLINAKNEGVQIGNFLIAGSVASKILDESYGNLPDDRYIHMLLAVRGEDVLPDGTARLKWPVYNGEGLGGYVIYRPLFEPEPLEEMQNMSRTELLRMGRWRRVNESAVTQNQMVVGGLSNEPGRLSLFLVCLEPEITFSYELSTMENPYLEYANAFIGAEGIPDAPEGGYVYVNWEIPDDPQVDYYRIYRSEVSSFKKPIDESTLEWTLVGDNLKIPKYTERVEQSFAHYYYYKVTSVSLWGVESAVGRVQRFRVPSTKPPETPNLLLPLSRKDGVQINFSAVSHCDRYEIYRAAIPVISDKVYFEMLNDNPEVLSGLFEPPSQADVFMTGILEKSLNPGSLPATAAQGAGILPVSRFKTIPFAKSSSITENIASLGKQSALDAYNQILDRFGPLALADYKDLSERMLGKIVWTKVGELSADEDTTEAVDPATGLLKPLSIIDTTARYGVKYLYTVQAWNDDNLGSSRPEPVEATPRRNRPFDPIDGLTGEIVDNVPHLSWNLARMSPLTPDQCLADTVGYIVYRSDKKDGTYYQASPLLFEPKWKDTEADIFAFNWYKVKVLDTGGYLSEFSEPIMVSLPFVSDLKTIIPVNPVENQIPDDPLENQIPEDPLESETPEIPEMDPPEIEIPEDLPEPAGTAPKITVAEKEFNTFEGISYSVQYELTGTVPITVSASVKDATGNSIKEFSIDKGARKFISDSSLKAGVYTVTLKAKNDFGEHTDSFTLKVSRKLEVGEVPKLDERSDQYSFKMITRSKDLKVKLNATGTKPLSWCLEPVSPRMNVPSQASIDSSGLLTVSKFIDPGTYRFVVRVTNSYGTDSKEISLNVTSLSTPNTPEKPKETTVPLDPLGLAYNGGDLKALSVSADQSPMLTAASTASQSPVPYVAPPAVSGYEEFNSDLVYCMNFRLTEVKLKKPVNSQRYSGTAKLDIGYETTIPVVIDEAEITKGSNYDTMYRGYAYITAPVELPSIGVKLVSLAVAPHMGRAEVSGYIKSTFNRNLVGDMYALEFEDAELQVGNIIVDKKLPVIRYEQFILQNHREIWIRLNGKQLNAKDLITLVGGKVIMKSHLETLNNEGLEFIPATNLKFDLQGRMSGSIMVDKEQSLQLLAPGGAALRVDFAALVFVDGEVLSGGYLSGKMVLPFEQEGVTGEGVPATYVGGHPKTNEMDELAAGNLTDLLEAAMRAGLIQFGETVQQNGLLIVPDDFSLQDKCSWIPIEVNDWTGKGFVMENSHLSPTRITERSLDTSTQRAQAMVVAPTGVTVDLDREGFLPKQGGSQTPNETEKPFWVGLIIKSGTLKLPPDFIQRDGGGAIDFKLAEGEMIYDLNGFNYQTYLYNTEGVPADFGEKLGGFNEVIVYDCLLDLYANRVNLEINAEARVDLLQNNWLKVKLYTNKEDNEDGKKGAFLCSVAPTMIEDALANDIDIKIDGGFFKEDGLHISGGLKLPERDAPVAGISSAEILAFSDMVIPADKTLAGNKTDALGRKYTTAFLTRPVNIDFEGFPMEIRRFELVHRESGAVRMNLYGATLLSDIIALSSDTTDQLIIECPAVLGNPKVIYDESLSVLETSFDGCVDVSGVLVPKKVQNAGGLVEFDTKELNFNFLQQLKGMPIKAETRFGYDEQNDRCYFAVGLVPGSQGGKISLGAGEVRNFTGMVTYNMEISRDEQQRFEFPNQAGHMKGFIENLKVHQGSDSTFAAGIRGTLEVSRLCEIRDLYFGFERGPSVSASGSLYLPLSISSVIEGDGGFTKVGSAAIRYSHPDRYFSFSMTLDRINLLLAEVGGSLGFEYSPRLFGVYLGYPETLVGNIGIFHLGMGVGFRIDEGGDSMVQAKMELGLDKSVEVFIVYLRGYLYAGADGAYYFADNAFTLELYLKGGIEGGIKVGSKKFNIISFYLDARGKIGSAYPFDCWSLACSCTVSYSLDLWLFEVEGSVNASFDTSIDWKSA